VTKSKLIFGALTLLLLGGAPASGKALFVETVWAGGGGAPRDLEIKVEDPATKSEVFRGLATVPGKLRLELPPGDYAVSAIGAGLWAGEVPLRLEPEGLAAEKNADHVALRIWPAAAIRGVLQVPAGKKIEKLVLEFSPAPLSSPALAKEKQVELPRGKVACALELPAFTCQAPIGLFDLRLRSKGFASLFSWGRAVSSKGLDLGRLKLQPGGSIVGALVAAGSRELPAGVKVQAMLQPPGPDGETGPRAALQTFDATLERGGLFHADGLGPGHYWLVASAPGFAPAQVGVQLPGAVEAELRDPLELSPPLTMTVLVEPAVDSDGQTWTLELSALDRYRQSKKVLDRLALPPGGFADFENLAPGAYTLRLLRQGRQPLLTKVVELAADGPPVILRIDSVQVEGRIELGSKPVAARIVFGGRNTGRKVETESDEDGRYQVELPEAGPWRVDVEASEPRINRRFRAVEVPKPRGSSPVTVDLHLPATELRGRVVDEKGSPVPRSMVYATPWEEGAPSPVFEEVSADGLFKLVGLPEGLVQVSAEAPGDLHAGPQSVELNEDLEPAPLELVLRAKLKVTGTIVGLGQPLPGARVIVAPTVGHPSALEVVPLLTGADGTFTAELPAGTREVDITAAAVGWTLKAERFPAAAGVRVELEPRGGRLELRGLGKETFSGWLLRRRASLVYPSVVREWSAIAPSMPEEGSLTLDGVAPGAYALCRLTIPEACVEGQLFPGGQLALDLPAHKGLPKSAD
jgi:hypothetical protein